MQNTQPIVESVTAEHIVIVCTDATDSIRFRMDFMLNDLLGKFPSLARKDGQRTFTHQQRLAVYRRDGGMCQLKLKCNGEKVAWDDWECDHGQPHTKGGPTTVENGVVACADCNRVKGGR